MRSFRKTIAPRLYVFGAMLALLGCSAAGGDDAGSPGGLDRSILGKWYEDASQSPDVLARDSEVFEDGGRGVYYRDGKPCYQFSYRLNGSRLAITADAASACGGTGIYDIAVFGRTLTEEHLPDHRSLLWYRPPDRPPPVQQKAKSHMCWIASVDKTKSGVTINFTSARRVFARYQSATPATGATSSTNVAVVASISGSLGDEFLSTNTPEDSCVMKVIREGDRIGVEASASFHPQGLPGVSAKEFIAAGD